MNTQKIIEKQKNLLKEYKFLSMELEMPEICTMEVDERIKGRLSKISFLESELAELDKEQGEDEEAPKYSTSWRDFTMTDKIKEQGKEQSVEEIQLAADILFKYMPELKAQEEYRAIQAMEAYASQKQPVLPTEEEIHKMTDLRFADTMHGMSKKVGFVIGVKWVIDWINNKEE
jgi:hypothetical protein